MPDNLDMTLSLSLDIGPYLLPTCGPLGIFWIHLRVPKWTPNGKNSIKTYFLVILSNFFH
jgi:hypothetical protein